MTRPTPDSLYPYSRSDVVRMTGASNPQVKILGTEVLKKQAQGTGNHLGYNDDDALRVMVSRELLRIGIQVSSIHSLFQSLETPALPTAKAWDWLKTEEARTQGAALVVIQPHALAAARTGAVYLTTAQEAIAWLQSKRTVIVIDVGGFIDDLEQHTGKRYGA